MAVLTSADVTVLNRWTHGGTGGRKAVSKLVSFNGSGVNPSTGQVPAAAFGFAKLIAASNFYIAGSTIYPSGVQNDGTVVKGFYGAAGDTAVTNLTSTVTMTVTGYE